MRVAVIGGGLFGVTTALALSEAGFDIDLYEKEDDIMTAASWANQWRLHRGYHYPRSPSTGRSCRDSATTFRERFPSAVIEDAEHYYCIAADERTKTTGEEFLSFCDDLGLEYEREHPPVVREEMTDVSVRVPENRIDPVALKAQCEQELAESAVDVHLGEYVDDLDALPHRYVVVAAYAGTNALLDRRSGLQNRCKFELCEKPVVKLPGQFDGRSVVVLDGPFMCFDPYGRTGNFLLGNVIHAVHETAFGLEPSFDATDEPLLNHGLIESPAVTKFEQLVESGREFIPGLTHAEHVGSLYTVRTVLAGVEDTDKRPTLLERDERVFTLFSGKLATCVDAAEEVVTRIAGETEHRGQD